MTKRFAVLLLLLLVDLLISLDASLATELRSRVVVVKPVILCDDDGNNPAPHVLPKTLVDQVYTKAGLEFVYLEPIRWNHGKARRGEINLDKIVRDGRRLRMICEDPDVSSGSGFLLRGRGSPLRAVASPVSPHISPPLWAGEADGETSKTDLADAGVGHVNILRSSVR